MTWQNVLPQLVRVVWPWADLEEPGASGEDLARLPDRGSRNRGSRGKRVAVEPCIVYWVWVVPRSWSQRLPNGHTQWRQMRAVPCRKKKTQLWDHLILCCCCCCSCCCCCYPHVKALPHTQKHAYAEGYHLLLTFHVNMYLIALYKEALQISPCIYISIRQR